MKQQSAQTGKQQGGLYGKAREHRYQDGGAEHGEHVLEAKQHHPWLAQSSRIVNRTLLILRSHGWNIVARHTLHSIQSSR